MAALANQVESDEAFAQRLQAQELGLNDATPLMIRRQIANPNGNPNPNPTVINARISELTSARATVFAILAINTPQIIAAIIVLSLHWDDTDVCDSSHTFKWKVWSAVSAARMFSYSLIIATVHVLKNWLEERPSLLMRVTSFRNLVDAFGLLWFIVGNMWLFGDEDNHCFRPQRSPVYSLCVSMLVINYIQICLPCILAVLAIPILCFCMPCVIRLLARLQNQRAHVGASDSMLQTVPLITITAENIHLAGDDSTCPVCLNEMTIGEEARLLACKHLFHKQCVDEWLRVNASCPTCRQSIIDDGHRGDIAGVAASAGLTPTTGQVMAHRGVLTDPVGNNNESVTTTSIAVAGPLSWGTISSGSEALVVGARDESNSHAESLIGRINAPLSSSSYGGSSSVPPSPGLDHTQV